MLITVDLAGDRALYLQIADGIAAALVQGTLSPGDRLPPGRELAATLGVNLETVQRAYRKLVADGVATSRVGRGTRIVDELDPSALGVNVAVDAVVDAARSAGLTVDELVSLVASRWSSATG